MSYRTDYIQRLYKEADRLRARIAEIKAQRELADSLSSDDVSRLVCLGLVPKTWGEMMDPLNDALRDLAAVERAIEALEAEQ